MSDVAPLVREEAPAEEERKASFLELIDVENAVTRLLVFAAMGGAFFMALAVPDAFQDEAAWFAVAYFVVRVLSSALYAWGVRADAGNLRAVLQLAPWFLVAATVALVGGFVDPD